MIIKKFLKKQEMKQLPSLISRLLYHTKNSCSFPPRHLTYLQQQQKALLILPCTPHLQVWGQGALLSRRERDATPAALRQWCWGTAPSLPSAPQHPSMPMLCPRGQGRALEAIPLPVPLHGPNRSSLSAPCPDAAELLTSAAGLTVCLCRLMSAVPQPELTSQPPPKMIQAGNCLFSATLTSHLLQA